MTLSDLIDQLGHLRERHGDVPVYLQPAGIVHLVISGATFEPTDDPEGNTPRGSVVIS
jgi:hypothetical protein